MNVRDKLLATIQVAELRKVTLKKSGGSVWVRPISYSLDRFIRAVLFGMNKPPFHEAQTAIEKRVFLERVCDQDGKPMFSEGDWDALFNGGEASREALEEIFDAVNDFDAGVKDEELKDAGNASGPILSDAQSSDSQSLSESGPTK